MTDKKIAECFKNLPSELVGEILSYKPAETLKDYAESGRRTKFLKINVENVYEVPNTYRFVSGRYKFKIVFKFWSKTEYKHKQLTIYSGAGRHDAYSDYYDCLSTLHSKITYFLDLTFDEYSKMMEWEGMINDVWDLNYYVGKFVKVRRVINGWRQRLKDIIGEEEMVRFLGLVDE